MINSKLYRKYYPITSEQEIYITAEEIYIEAKRFRSRLKIEMMLNEYTAVNSIKPTINFLGYPNYKNISHNEIIWQHFCDIQEKLEKKRMILDSVLEHLTFHEFEKISIDELNYILESMNKERHKFLLKNMLSLICISVLACVFTCVIILL